MSPNTSTLHRALGVDEMFAALNRGGWTGSDLKDYASKLKMENFDALERFSGGELSRQFGTPLYPFLLEITALRYILAEHEKKTRARHLSLVKCPHGFVGTCRTCEREMA